jgi:DnaA family protein
MRQLPLSVRLPDTARLASFVPGANGEVLHLLESIGNGAPRTIWLWGRTGSGKTHLLQAACAAVAERGGTACYLEPGTESSPEQIGGCELLDLVCLDRVELIAGDAAWNAALFRLHTLMQDGAGRLLIASTLPPSAVEFVLPDLRSRLLAASVHQLHELEDVDLVAALQCRARHRGLELGEEAALYLVHRLPRDMHSLMAVLDELDLASLAAQRRLTVPFLRQALELHSSGPD